MYSVPRYLCAGGISGNFFTGGLVVWWSWDGREGGEGGRMGGRDGGRVEGKENG